MFRNTPSHAGLPTARPGRRVARNLVAGLVVAAILTGAGCSTKQTKDADIITTDSASAPTAGSVPIFDTDEGYTPTGDNKLDAFCTGLAELDENSIIQNQDLALKIRVVVMLRVFDEAVPNAPAEAVEVTTKIRDFLREAAKIETEQVTNANQEFLRLAASMGLSAPLTEFLEFVRNTCGFTLDIDPTGGQ